MSSKKTQNLGLHTWEKTDAFMMDEFNENFGALDKAVAAKAGQTDLEALTAQVSALDAGKAGQSALEALIAQVAAKAEQTALDTEKAAREALAAGQLRFKFDSYPGTGAATVRLTFDFKPLLVIVSPHNDYIFGGHAWVRGVNYGRTVQNSVTTLVVPLTWENRAVQWDNSQDSRYPEYWLNDSNRTYWYLAIGIKE